MRWLKTAGGLFVIMLLMSSCLRVDGSIKIEDDGSGTVDYLTAVNADALTSVLGTIDLDDAEVGDPNDLCGGFEADLGDPEDIPANAVVTPYDEDGFCGSRIQFDLAPSFDQSANIAGILDPSTRLYKEGDNWFFESDFDSDEISSETAGAPEAMLDAVFADASFRLVVDLPGRAVEGQNNATEVDSDGRFVWDVDILNPPARFFAQTEPGSGGGSGGGGLNPIIIGVVVALLAAGLAFFLINKRKTDTVDTPPDGTLDAAPQHAAMPVVDGPAITATPPTAATLPVMPAAEAVKETIVMNAADIQQSIQDAAAPEPVFDEALNAWILDDPTRGRLRHDPATDTWNPA